MWSLSKIPARVRPHVSSPKPKRTIGVRDYIIDDLLSLHGLPPARIVQCGIVCFGHCLNGEGEVTLQHGPKIVAVSRPNYD